MNEKDFGKTGEFPDGKLTPSDEGEIQFGITHQNGYVIIAFGTPVTWIGLPPEEALEMARAITEHAKNAMN